VKQAMPEQQMFPFKPLYNNISSNKQRALLPVHLLSAAQVNDTQPELQKSVSI
jgi:hypothetical protein